MMCEICGKDKVVQVLRLKLSDEEEPREVKICDECAGKMKTKKR
jgi:protein-arginine kinase activator protein McsA